MIAKFKELSKVQWFRQHISELEISRTILELNLFIKNQLLKKPKTNFIRLQLPLKVQRNEWGNVFNMEMFYKRTMEQLLEVILINFLFDRSGHTLIVPDP